MPDRNSSTWPHPSGGPCEAFVREQRVKLGVDARAFRLHGLARVDDRRNEGRELDACAGASCDAAGLLIGFLAPEISPRDCCTMPRRSLATLSIGRRRHAACSRVAASARRPACCKISASWISRSAARGEPGSSAKALAMHWAAASSAPTSRASTPRPHHASDDGWISSARRYRALASARRRDSCIFRASCNNDRLVAWRRLCSPTPGGLQKGRLLNRAARWFLPRT